MSFLTSLYSLSSNSTPRTLLTKNLNSNTFLRALTIYTNLLDQLVSLPASSELQLYTCCLTTLSHHAAKSKLDTQPMLNSRLDFPSRCKPYLLRKLNSSSPSPSLETKFFFLPSSLSPSFSHDRTQLPKFFF